VVRPWPALALLIGCHAPAATPGPAGTALVEHVVDGDTIDVVIDGREERVRLLGVDTPEISVDRGPPECFGPEAASFTAGRLPAGTRVRLERDVVGRDDYGRLLAYVYRTDDGALVNEELVRLGFARPLWIEPNGILRPRIVEAARTAEREALGLWAACGG
jgi:micrococcal nuclease